MPKVSEWSKTGDDYIKRAEESWSRDWGEAFVAIFLDGSSYQVEVNEGMESEVIVQEASTLDDARSEAVKFMDSHSDDPIFKDDREVEETIIEYMQGKQFDFSRDNIASFTASSLNRNYHVNLEYESPDGDIELVTGEFESIGTGVGLTADRERGFIRKVNIDVREQDLVIGDVLDNLGLISNEMFKEVQRARVQGEPLETPESVDMSMLDVEDEITQALGNHFAENVASQLKSNGVEIFER